MSLLRLHALPPFTHTLKLSLHTEAKDMHPHFATTNAYTHTSTTLLCMHTQKNSRNHKMHILMDLLSSDCNFFTVFLVNRQLTGLTALTKTLAERSVCVLVQGGFSKISLSEACNFTERSFRQKTKKTVSKKQEILFRRAKGNLNWKKKKKVLLCMNLLLNLKKVLSFMTRLLSSVFLISPKLKKENQFLKKKKKKKKNKKTITLNSPHSWNDLT